MASNQNDLACLGASHQTGGAAIVTRQIEDAADWWCLSANEHGPVLAGFGGRQAE